MAFLSSFFKSFYVKALFVIILGGIGITAGIKIGYAYFAPESEHSFAGPQAPPASSLSFGPGDLFPWENYVTQNGGTGNFEQLLANKKSVILFTDLACPTCLDLVAFWKKVVQPEVLSDVQQIICLPPNDNPIPGQYAGLFDNFTVVFVTLFGQKNTKNI